MPNTSSPPSAAASASLIDSRQAAWRLLTTLGRVVLGNSSMDVVSVVLPAVQAEFGVGRADASLPYTLMMVCRGLGGFWTGRMADRAWADAGALRGRGGCVWRVWLGGAVGQLGHVCAADGGHHADIAGALCPPIVQHGIKLIGMALGGWMSGWIFDLTGSYRAAFLNGMAWNLLNLSIVGWLFWRVRQQRAVTGRPQHSPG